MLAVAEFTGSDTGGVKVSRKKTDKPNGEETTPKVAGVGRPNKGEPVHLRLPKDILDDIATIERAHRFDTSTAIRYVLSKHLAKEVALANEVLDERERLARTSHPPADSK